jgi:hypothetical protein
MADTTIHFPVTFLFSDPVRALRRELDAVATPDASQPQCSVLSAPVLSAQCGFLRLPADFYVYRMWLDWGREGVAVRKFVSGSSEDDPLVVNIEQWCDWHGERGALVQACLRCGVLRKDGVDSMPGNSGLELVGFAIHNAHLAPDFVGRERKGGLAKGLNARLKNIHTFARQQAELMMKTGTAGPLAAADSDLRLRALGLVMGIEGAAGREQRRPQDYPPDLLAAALEAVQRLTPEKISAAILEVAENATNPAFATDPQIIIKRLLE